MISLKKFSNHKFDGMNSDQPAIVILADDSNLIDDLANCVFIIFAINCSVSLVVVQMNNI